MGRRNKSRVMIAGTMINAFSSSEDERLKRHRARKRKKEVKEYVKNLMRSFN